MRLQLARPFEIVDQAHPTVAGLDWYSAGFTLCGYNRVTLKPDAHLVARYHDDGDPRGRSHRLVLVAYPMPSADTKEGTKCQ